MINNESIPTHLYEASDHAAPLARLIAELEEIRVEMHERALAASAPGAKIHAHNRHSATNLLHYLALRSRDLRLLQRRLARSGLSSLGRAEAHVMASFDAVLNALYRLAEVPRTNLLPDSSAIDFDTGQQLLRENADELLGPRSMDRSARIMVTLPAEAATDPELVRELIRNGMECARINCAHDDALAWARMLFNVRAAEAATGKRCPILMDLAGPKLRTGSISAEPEAVKWRPQRDRFGRVLAPARIWLYTDRLEGTKPLDADACLPVPEAWLVALHAGDIIKLVDTRGAHRTWTVREITDQGVRCEDRRTTYVTEGTRLHLWRDEFQIAAPVAIGALPPRKGVINLRTDDKLILTDGSKPGRPAVLDKNLNVLEPAQIPCSLPEVFADVRAGESIWFDDGKIGGVVEEASADCLHIRITHARARGEKLRADKGINFPDSTLRLPALTAKDLEDLEIVARHSDLVGLSFVNSAEDVIALQEQLERLVPNDAPAIILKIETRRGFAQLPALLLAALRAPRTGVMIARGDLAVECGFERLAEIQEEILWVCEAAHVPVIWATQVLEHLAKDGLPSRAEITDAAMSHRAECVMLNKGPHIDAALRTLDGILQRMEAHQNKKQAMLRELHLARAFDSRGLSAHFSEQACHE